MRAAAILSLLLLVVAAASAQWPTDPSVNLPIAVRTSEQVVPHVSTTADGGCYVGWYDLSFGVYAICLQRLDAAGNAMWPANGILVSDNPQLSYVTDWDLTTDAEGCAVLVVSDARDGEDLDPHAYRIAPDGTELWGADGITLSGNTEFEPAPSVTLAGNGDLVFVWQRGITTGGGAIQMQRLSPDGTARFPLGGIAVVSSTTEHPGFPRLVASDNGAMIMTWNRDTYQTGLRHIRAQKFSAAGVAVWPAVVNVYDAASVPMGYGPDLQTDQANGAFVLWHSAPGMVFNTMVQHLSSAGVEIFPHNGVTVSTDGSRNHLDAALSYHADTGEIFVFWNERNVDQNQWGLYGQKFTAAGVRAWGATGIQYLPLTNVFKHTQRSAPMGDGAAVFFIEETGGANSARVLGLRVNAAGTVVWGAPPTVISSYPSGKSRLPIAQDGSERVTLIWEDKRNDFADVFGQTINPDGSLGGAPTAAPEPAPLRLARIQPNPFHGSTWFALGAAAPDARVRIWDASGREVRCLAPDGAGRVAWDGTDQTGRALPGGVYFYRLAGPWGVSGAQRAVLVR